MTEEGKSEWFVPFGNGAIAKVEDTAKFREATGSFWLLHMLCKSPKCIYVPVCGGS